MERKICKSHRMARWNPYWRQTVGDPKRQEVPTKKGISLLLHRWKLLANNMDFVDKALDEKTEYATHLGGNVYATMKASVICVVVRQHWLSPNQTEVVPTKKGITLRPGGIRQIKRCGHCDLWLCTRTEFGSTVSLQIGSHESVGFLILSRMQPRSLCGMVNKLWRLL